VRIASLLPAATEIVGSLGLADRLVAVTFECDHPAGIRDRVPVVVDSAVPPGLAPAGIDALVRERVAAGLPLYALDRDALHAAAPDLVLTQDLCRVCALPAGTAQDALAALGLRAEVLSLDPHTVGEVLDAIAAVGRHAGTESRAARVVAALRARLDAVAAAVAAEPVTRVLVLEWVDPPFLAGHWVPGMLRTAGGVAVGSVEGAASSSVTWDEALAEPVDAVLVAPCGYGLPDALAQAHAVRDRLPGVPVVAVDSAAIVVRAGPRLVEGVEAIAWALHPAAVPAPPPGRVALLP
jgi:iron complex transport system substrate-binding protein